MRRSKRFGQALTTKDWLKYRPDKKFYTCDGYSLKLANSIFEYLNKPDSGFRDIFDRELLKERALVTACCFDFFLRFYKPGSFGETTPNLTLLPEERIN